MSVGESVKRVDAYEKVTGHAKYTDDLCPRTALVAKVLHSTIASGYVKSIEIEEALKVKGVVKIATCFEVPSHTFPTAGHPWSTDSSHQDVADRRLLNTHIRYYGDDIAAVIAEDEVAASRALRLIKVEYETFTPLLTPNEAMHATSAPPIHENYPDNILCHSDFEIGHYEEAIKDPDLIWFEGEYDTQMVQHCHIEPAVSFAYEDNHRMVVVSSTQIPHIMRRVIAQALGVPFGQIRVIKPYIGGGFGNKQDVLYEPLNAFLSKQVGGKCVKLELSREEVFTCTRTRHSIQIKLKTGVRADGRIVTRKIEALANQGAYASHGHAIVSNAITGFRHIYQQEKAVKADAYTVFTNLPCGGAMRGYGIPQVTFACESHMQDIAEALHLDPIAFRIQNAMQLGYKDPFLGITCYSSGLKECVEKGMEYIHWHEKYPAYQNQTGPIRKGVGMGIFSYKTGVYPISLETASARLVLNQDGSAQLQMGATEIGQGADTVFSQMAAETIGFTLDQIHIVSTQDTDISPFDTGAYASRQTYVSGMAVKKTAALFKERLLSYAAYLLKVPESTLDIQNNEIIDSVNKDCLITLPSLALEAFYNLDYASHITAESSVQCKNNTISFGVCFAEIEVDLALGRIKVLDMINVHDSGVLINPQLAKAQVHGGMSMGLGYALSEQLLFDAKGKPLNPNLLDYKLPTSMDTPDLAVDFVETVDPSGPYGNKSLGEPPAIPVAPAIRNALLQATGIAFNSLPITPHKMIEKFKENGLI